jgi:hypothetical protein
MKEDYGKITTLRAEGKQKHIDEILSFWKKYGSYINPILLITPDPSMMIERKKDENATYGQYYSSLKGYLKVPQLQTINESVVSNGLAEHNASSYFEARPETLFQMLKLKHMGELDNDKDVTHLFKFTLLEKLKSIKHLKVLGKDGKEDVDATKILRKENYKKWHIAVTKWLCNNATQNFSQGSKQPHVRKIARVFGYTYPDEQYSFQDDKNGDVNVHALPAGYLRQIDHDFEAYMSAGDVDINNLHRDMITERKAITENKVSDILQFVRGAQPVQKKKKQK